MLPTVSTSNKYKEYQLKESGYKFRVFDSISTLSNDWDTAQPPKNIYLQRPILKAIEEAPPLGIDCCYLIYYKENQPIGVAYCQLLHFKTDKNVQDKSGKGTFSSITGSVKTFLAKQFSYSLLVCGNLLFTGEHGYYFDPAIIDQKQVATLLDQSLEKTQSYWKDRNVKTDGIFIKDVEETKNQCRESLMHQKFREFLFHPNMVLNRRPHWHGMEDYLQDISSKYRVRAKKAFKCGKTIEKVVLNQEQMNTHVDHLYGLYKGVMDSAKFNMVVLHKNYIIKLKENLGDRFKVTGYYIDGDLVGYRTNIHNYDELEAHFLGYNQQYNRNYKLYMNMLLDSLEQGILLGVDRIVYARTAMEIKSTIGAVPEELFCYIRANNKMMNFIMPPILEYFRPEDNWIQRNPFK